MLTSTHVSVILPEVTRLDTADDDSRFSPRWMSDERSCETARLKTVLSPTCLSRLKQE